MKLNKCVEYYEKQVKLFPHNEYFAFTLHILKNLNKKEIMEVLKVYENCRHEIDDKKELAQSILKAIEE